MEPGMTRPGSVHVMQMSWGVGIAMSVASDFAAVHRSVLTSDVQHIGWPFWNFSRCTIVVVL